MKTNTILMGALALLLVTGCKNQTTTAASTEQARTQNTAAVSEQAASNPEELGTIGAEIKAHPSDAKKILSDRGMTEASFEKAIRTVSSDPALSRRYAEAYKKSSKS
jgi:hypothetical protein